MPDGMSSEMPGFGTTGTGDPKPQAPLKLYFGSQALAAQPLGTIVEGTLHAGALTLVYGPPKSGKSFWVTDLALAIADAARALETQRWMGREIVRPGPMLYVACEGHAGFWKRLRAAAVRRGWKDGDFPKGFVLATGRPRLIKQDARGQCFAPDPSAILEALQMMRERGLEPVGIVIDTVYRSFGGGNVNASPDMNAYLEAISALTDQGLAVALVHHEVKSGGTAAGSVALLGAADTIIHIWRDAQDKAKRFFEVEYAKDDAEAGPHAFKLEVEDVGLDPDGRKASSCVIVDEGDAPEAKKGPGRPKSETSDRAILEAAAQRELHNLLASPFGVVEVSVVPGAPKIRAVLRSLLKATLIDRGILVAPDPKLPPKEFARKQDAIDRAFQRCITTLIIHNKFAGNAKYVGLPK